MKRYSWLIGANVQGTYAGSPGIDSRAAARVAPATPSVSGDAPRLIQVLELRGILAFALRQAGYLVVEAGDGVEALEAGRQAAAGDFELDVELRTVTVAGRGPWRLTRLELRLTQTLLAHAGRALPAERLLAAVWGSRAGGDRQLLKQLVHRLRQKIEETPAEPRYLVTVAGVGYVLDPEGKGGGASEAPR